MGCEKVHILGTLETTKTFAGSTWGKKKLPVMQAATPKNYPTLWFERSVEYEEFFHNFNALTFNELLLEDPFPEKHETLLTKECTECRSSSR